IAERITAQPRARLIKPPGLHRSRGDRWRQHRQNVVARLAPFAVQRLPPGQFLLASAVVAQRMRTDGDPRAVLQLEWCGDALAVDERAVGRFEIAQHNAVAMPLEPAV